MTPIDDLYASALASDAQADWMRLYQVVAGLSLVVPLADAAGERLFPHEFMYRILRSGTPPPIEAHDPHVLVHGRTAMVTCTEDLGEGRLIATNTFVLQDGHWRLTGHQARPLPDPPN